MQQIPETGEQGFSQQRVVAALTKLSRLALQTGRQHFSPPGTADRLAALFLDQLVALCEAQQGALFLTHPFALNAQETVSTAPILSLLARTNMSVEEVQTALAISVPVPELLQSSVDLPSTMIWQRSLNVTFPPLSNSDNTAFPRVSSFSATLLFIWPAVEKHIQDETQRQAIQLLPFLADLVDTILLHIHTARHESQESGEIFPAELLATIGHELRGPLTTIQGYATTLLLHEQQLAFAERRDFLHAISKASAHLGKLVDRFLELAQFESHTHAFIPMSVNLLALAQEAMTAVSKSTSHHLLLVPSLARKDASVEEEKGEVFRDELTLSGDRRLLKTMLDILLENAVVYSAPGSRVEVSIEPMDAASVLATWHTLSGSGKHLALIVSTAFQEQESLLIVRVQDHGIGIDPAHLSLIFRRFYRVDTSLTRKVNGLGLGLALCEAIVALHRGMLWVESVVDKGSIFSLVLPVEFSQESNERVEIEQTGWNNRHGS